MAELLIPRQFLLSSMLVKLKSVRSVKGCSTPVAGAEGIEPPSTNMFQWSLLLQNLTKLLQKAQHHSPAEGDLRSSLLFITQREL